MRYFGVKFKDQPKPNKIYWFKADKVVEPNSSAVDNEYLKKHVVLVKVKTHVYHTKAVKYTRDTPTFITKARLVKVCESDKPLGTMRVVSF